MPTEFNIAAEGIVDLAIARKLLSCVGAAEGPFARPLNGKQNLLERLPNYARAARRQRWLILIDLDRDGPCAADWLSRQALERPDWLVLRVAVRAAESWLLADAEAMAEFLDVPVGKIPRDTDGHDDPKRLIVDLARASRRRVIRESLCPRPSSGRVVGPLYSSDISRFAIDLWDPRKAVREGRSKSLARALRHLDRVRAG